MKIFYLLSSFVVSASALVTFSTDVMATSQLQNGSTNSELQSLQISELSNSEIANSNNKGQNEPQRGVCNPAHPLFPFCGWW